MKTITIKGHPKTKTPIKVPKVKNVFEGAVVFEREGKGTNPYTGQFGFDWMDFKKQQLHKAVGKSKYVKSKENYRFNSKTTASEFSKLEKEYENFEFKGYLNDIGKTKYYIPWFCAFKNAKHKLYLAIEIKKPVDGVIKLECKNTNVVFSKTDFSTKGKSASKLGEVVEISFKKSITSHTKVEAKFYDDAKKNTKGIVIGALNIFKNDVEYNMKLKYVKVLIKGSIKVEKEKEEIVLDPVAKKYKFYTDKINEFNNEINELKKKRKKLEKELKDIKADPPHEYNIFATTESDVKDDIKELDNDLKEINKKLKEVKRQYSVAKKIDVAQDTNLKNSVAKINAKKGFLEGLFGQALVHYNNIGTDNLEIEASDYKEYLDFTDDIEVYLDGGDYKIRYTEGDDYDTGEFKQRTLEAYTKYKKDENYILMIPFNMHSSKSKRGILLGSAEVVGHEGNKAIMLPRADASTIVHEVGHVFNLYHTFSNKHINFCKGTLENIMDYEDLGLSAPGIPSTPIKNKTTFFKWQWEIIHNDPHLTKKNV